MNENFNIGNFGSKEKEYLIDPESGYYKALSFAADPVAYFTAYKKELEADGFLDEDICQQAMAEMLELEDIIGNQDIKDVDERVRQMMTAEYGSELWTKATFGLLKAAGITREQALAWVILEDDELTNEELLKERTLRYFIQAVYNEEI